MNPLFDPQPVLSCDMLELRPFNLDDLEALYLVASAPEVWEDHPAKDRHHREVFEPYAKFLLSSGTMLVVIDRQTRKIIGCSRYYVSSDHPESISIGFTLRRQMSARRRRLPNSERSTFALRYWTSRDAPRYGSVFALQKRNGSKHAKLDSRAPNAMPRRHRPR